MAIAAFRDRDAAYGERAERVVACHAVTPLTAKTKAASVWLRIVGTPTIAWKDTRVSKTHLAVEGWNARDDLREFCGPARHQG